MLPPKNETWWENAEKYLIMPDSKAAILINFIFMVIHWVDIITFTYIIAFQMHSLNGKQGYIFRGWENISDAAMLINIIVTFFIAIEVTKTK